MLADEHPFDYQAVTGALRSESHEAAIQLARVGRLDALAVALLVLGLGYSVLTRDKLGLVVAFAGVTLLARGVVTGRKSEQD